MGSSTWSIAVPNPKKKAYPASGGRALLRFFDGRELPVAAATGRALAAARRKGFEPLDDRELQAKLRVIDEERAWAWLLTALNRRDFSRSEAGERLLRKGFLPESAERAVARAVELRFIDDARYLETFTSQKIAQGWGRQRILRELEERGVDIPPESAWVERHFDPENEEERAQGLLARRSLPAKNAYEKWVRFLVTKGFDFQTAKWAARAELRRRTDDEEGE